MISDMNRLEQAARVSMGGFHDSEASAPRPPSAPHPSLRFVALCLAAIIVEVALFQLVY
jgi:hypothetical protein